MRYLGVDPSLNGTGLCAVSDDGGVIHLETIRPGDLRGAARLDLIERVVKAFLEESATFVALEEYAYHAVGDQVFQLGEVGGIVRLLAFRSGSPYEIVNPMLLKKFATGSSSAEKAHMIEAATALGARPADDNQADAFFLARIALVMARPAAAKFRHEMDVVHRLRNPPPKKKQRRPRRLVPNAL